MKNEVYYTIDNYIYGEEGGICTRFDSYKDAVENFGKMQYNFEPFGYTKDGYKAWVDGKEVLVKGNHLQDTLGTAIYMVTTKSDGSVAYEQCSSEVFRTYEEWLEKLELEAYRKKYGTIEF